MKINFSLFNYFPYGGLQRDFLQIADECYKLGFSISVYTTDWQGHRPDAFEIHILSVPIKEASNHQKMLNFQSEIVKIKKASPDTTMVGFNKIEGLDVYFAADTCFKEKAVSERSWLYRLTPRHKAYEKMERAVFNKNNSTLILTLTKQQQIDFQKHYQTQDDRFKLLPPGISRNLYISDQYQINKHYRNSFNISKDSTLLLSVASSFATKGLDRSIIALASLPKATIDKTYLLVVGGDKPKRFIRQARKLGVHRRIIFAGSRDDIAKIMLCADMLIHPAYTESAGMVLLEALAAGLPVLTTQNCGYATHIKAARAGVSLPVPFKQKSFNQSLLAMIESPQRALWQKNAKNYAEKEDLYSLHQRAAQLIVKHLTSSPT